MEILTFIQFRHRADNSLSKPKQKAAAEKLIATPGLATVVHADMVTAASGEKPVQFNIVAAGRHRHSLGTTRMLKIYGRANSINVRKVLWLCEELGLPFEREDWGRGYQPTSDAEFRRLSRFSVVPVVDDDGFLLRESNTIARYLAARYGAANGAADLYPEDIRARATIEAWMDWAATDVYTGLRPVYLGLHVKTPEFVGKSEIIDWGIGIWTRQMRTLDAEFEATGLPFVTGDRFTIADIPVGLVVNRWYGVDFTKPELPAVARYYARLSERPGYRMYGRNGTP
jgi:glutathione S-transferase